MTAEELAERIRRRKKRLCKITISQAIACNWVYDRLGGLPISIELLDKDQAEEELEHYLLERFLKTNWRK